jgi:hypothetical protein
MPDELGDERVEPLLDHGRQPLLRGRLGRHVCVAAATDEQPAVRQLVPVVEAVARVVRDREQELLDRLGHDDLVADRRHDGVEFRHEAARVTVGGEHDDRRLEPVDRLDSRMFAQVGAGLSRSRRKPPHPACRLDGAVGQMPEAAAEASELRR